MSNCSFIQPVPTAQIVRPPFSRSSVANAFAVCTGGCQPAIRTEVPTSIRSVAAEAHASTSTVSR